jgi:transcriptional regulator with XRE-family HTH domain
MAEDKGLGALEGLPQALSRLVERYGRQQKDIAPGIGISPSSLSRILSGKNRPAVDTLGLLLETLGCTLWDLAAVLDEVTGRKSPHTLNGPLLLAVLPVGDLVGSQPQGAKGLGNEALKQLVEALVEKYLKEAGKDGKPPADPDP